MTALKLCEPPQTCITKAEVVGIKINGAAACLAERQSGHVKAGSFEPSKPFGQFFVTYGAQRNQQSTPSVQQIAGSDRCREEAMRRIMIPVFLLIFTTVSGCNTAGGNSSQPPAQTTNGGSSGGSGGGGY